MKKNGLALLIAAFIIFGMPLFAGGKKEEVKVKEAPAPGEPQYGGTLTYLNQGCDSEPKTWDNAKGYWISWTWCNFYQSTLVTADIDKYGLRGTGDFAWNIAEVVPEQYMIGDLAESWEITADKLTFHLKKGVMWTGKSVNPGVMEPREVTAYDVEFHQNRFKESPVMQGFYVFVDRMYAKDRYTFVVELNYYDFNWGWWIGYANGNIPPEVVEAGADDWKNQVGSGPFILTDYIPGSSITYKRNPNWHMSAIINGKEYDDVPFIDTLILPLIPDESSQIAALRTGKVDMMTEVPYKYVDTLTKTSPKLVQHLWLDMGCEYVNFKCDKPPFDNRNVRRALAVGTDREAIATAVYEKAEVQAFYEYGSPVWTPLEKLPPETRILYKYDPDLARQMLADAGYPDGFNTEIHMCPSRLEEADICALLVDQWAKIGVKVKLVPYEAVHHSQLRDTHKYNHILIDADGASTIELLDRLSTNPHQAAVWKGKAALKYDSWYQEASVIIDPVERAKEFKDLIVYYFNENSSMQMPCPYLSTYWWPWVKNYYGETETGFIDTSEPVARIWLDKDLKAKLGWKVE